MRCKSAAAFFTNIKLFTVCNLYSDLTRILDASQLLNAITAPRTEYAVGSPRGLFIMHFTVVSSIRPRSIRRLLRSSFMLRLIILTVLPQAVLSRLIIFKDINSAFKCFHLIYYGNKECFVTKMFYKNFTIKRLND